jgi:hypothetical protein
MPFQKGNQLGKNSVHQRRDLTMELIAQLDEVMKYKHPLTKEQRTLKHEDLIVGKRPMLAIGSPPQHGKSWAATDLIAWIAGKNPDARRCEGLAVQHKPDRIR